MSCVTQEVPRHYILSKIFKALRRTEASYPRKSGISSKTSSRPKKTGLYIRNRHIHVTNGQSQEFRNIFTSIDKHTTRLITLHNELMSIRQTVVTSVDIWWLVMCANCQTQQYHSPLDTPWR